MKNINHKAKTAANYLLNIFIFLIFSALCCVPVFIIFDYISLVDAGGSKLIELNSLFAKGLTIYITLQSLLAGIWLGWKIRLHSIYRDIHGIEDSIQYAEAKACIQKYGREKGWEK